MKVLSDKMYLWKTWIAFFIYTSLVSVFIQLIILPGFLPQWHYGNGLVITCFDSIRFHNIAVGLAQKIHTLGWGAWQLRPESQAPAGIAAAAYALFVPKPWILIPLNAALHASAALLLLLIINRLLSNVRQALWCVLPFLVYPSAASWYAQLHKDGLVIFGFYLFVYGWVVLASINNSRNLLFRLGESLACIISGAFFCWIMRPYSVEIMGFLSTIVAAFILAVLIVKKIRKSMFIKALPAILSIMAAVMIMLTFFPKDALRNHLGAGGAGTVSYTTNSEITKHGVYTGGVDAIHTISRYAPQSNTVRAQAPPPAISEHCSFFSEAKSYFFSFLNYNFTRIVSFRDGFLSAKGKTSIDADLNFSSIPEMLSYIPRAAQIVFFAPFPEHWFDAGSYESTTFMRRIAAFEMLGVYISLLFIPFAFWNWRKRAEMWVGVIISMLFSLFYGLVVCNIGTLYRMRYGFIMFFVALGIAGAIKLFELARHLLTKKITCAD